MVTVLIVLAVVLVLALVAGLLVVPARRRRELLEPPPAARSGSVAVAERETSVGTEVVGAAEVVEEPEVDEPVGTVEMAETIVEEPVEMPVDEVSVDTVEVVDEPALSTERPRFRDRLGKARAALGGALGSIAGRTRIDESVWDELEEALILADVGVASTQQLLDSVRARVRSEGLTNGDEVLAALKTEITARLDGFDRELAWSTTSGPTVWLFVGVNGVGKTTTIGKIGARESADGHRVLMAAGDTFRAAAAEQLGMWAERCGAELVRGNEGGDPAAVIFDGIEAADARGIELVLGDTAGRLHTKVNLMEELRKVRRVADKGAGTVTEVLLVLDATTGQNGLVQAEQFTEAVDLTGVVLTKLDGSAKGGIVVAIHDRLGIPVKLVGLGEGIDDLVPFDPTEYVEALFT